MKIEGLNKLEQEIIKINGIRFIKFNKLEELGVKHVMTTKDFDMGVSTCNNDEKLREEYKTCLKVMGSTAIKPWCLHQTHTDITFKVKEDGEIKEHTFAHRTYEGDGYVTNEVGIPLAITVADCVPVVIYDAKNKVISNIHSGWKGTYKEICPKALEKMIKEYGTNSEDVYAFIGPHIGFNDFEVTKELEESFKEKFSDIDDLIRVKDEDHFIIDLTKVISYGLLNLGVKKENIYASCESTVSNNELYHSFRRDGKAFGCMSLIVEL